MGAIESGRSAERSGGTVHYREHLGAVHRPRTPARGHLHTTRSSKTEPGYIGTLTGHFAVFSEWTEINSPFEGRFLEQIAPGAFTKTFVENRQGMRCLFQHGRDPSVGMKPLGSIRQLAEDGRGAMYEVDLIDAAYVEQIRAGLKAGLYGASFRFQVIREEVNARPVRSDHNPEGIEERTITEAKVREFGPVTFPAYSETSAGLRSRSAPNSGQLSSRAVDDVQRRRQPWRLPRARSHRRRSL